MRFDLEVAIERPVATVFEYVTDVRNLPEWQESAISADWIVEGRRFRERRSFLGRTVDLELEVITFEEARRFDVRAVKGPVPFQIEHSFVDGHGTTKLRVVASAKLGGALRLAGRMAQGQAERQFRGDLQRLREVLLGREEQGP